MNIMEDIRTVTLADLVPDRCNFKDDAFAEWVNEFMNRNMPSFPLGLLDTSSAEAFERWQVQPEDRYKVVDLDLVVYVCHDCGEEYPFWEGKEPDEVPVCCPLEALARQDGAEVEEEPELFEREERKWLVLKDDHYVNEEYVERAGEHMIELPEPEGESVWGWYENDRDSAVQAANEKDHESMQEQQHGFPWANSWCWLPDDFITDQELKDAGFTVATYCGGKGDWREDNEYRLCGVDGGGYSFKGQHFAPLAAAVAARCNWTVETDEGPAHIKAEDE